MFEAGGADLMAGQQWFGQLEGRIQRTVEELAAAKKLIWYIPDILQMARSGTHQGQAASVLDQILPAVVVRPADRVDRGHADQHGAPAAAAARRCAACSRSCASSRSRRRRRRTLAQAWVGRLVGGGGAEDRSRLRAASRSAPRGST